MSKLNQTAGFGPCFLLPGLHFGVTLFLTHTQIKGRKWEGFCETAGGFPAPDQSACIRCGKPDAVWASGLEIKLATHTNDSGNKLWVGQIPLGTSKERLANGRLRKQ